jgi:hypothetical protein
MRCFVTKGEPHQNFLFAQTRALEIGVEYDEIEQCAMMLCIRRKEILCDLPPLPTYEYRFTSASSSSETWA